jgi:hypothetical protein
MDPKAATAMAHLEMDRRGQAPETPLAMAADRAMTTTIPQITVARATLELEILAVAKAEAAHDLLAHPKTLEALPMVARTTTTRSKVVLKEAAVQRATIWRMTMRIAHLQDALPKARHQLNRQSLEQHLQLMSSHLAILSSLSPQTSSKLSLTTNRPVLVALQVPEQVESMPESKAGAVVVRAQQIAQAPQGLVAAELLLMLRRMLLPF